MEIICQILVFVLFTFRCPLMASLPLVQWWDCFSAPKSTERFISILTGDVVTIKITRESLNMEEVLKNLLLKFYFQRTYSLLIFYMISLYSNVLGFLGYLLSVYLVFERVRPIEPVDSLCRRKYCCQWKETADYFPLGIGYKLCHAANCSNTKMEQFPFGAVGTLLLVSGVHRGMIVIWSTKQQACISTWL